MRARSFGLAVAAVAVGYLLVTGQGAVVGFTLMVLGALWFWGRTRRWGVRR